MKRNIAACFSPERTKGSEFVQLPGLVFRYCNDTKRYNVQVVFSAIGLWKSDLKDILLVFVLIFLISLGVFGQQVPVKSCTAIHIANPPSIDGILNDESWKEGPWTGDFTQNEPFNGSRASQGTEFKIAYDDNNIYVAIKAYDASPDSIVPRLTRRDQTDGDLLAICLDSYHDMRTGFLFGVSAAGVKYDEIFTNDGQNMDPAWDPDWWVKTSVNKEGWNAEMKIPFSQIRFEKNPGLSWGLELARVIYRKNETDFWQHIPKDAPGLIHNFGELKGLELIRPRKILDITPFFVFKTETFRADKENPFRSSGRKFGLNGGLDSKIGITSNLTMDLTINPDFGQVEADPSVVNLTAFETFYKEQRPFFVEGNNITDFNIGIGDDRVGNDNLFYSRRIGRSPQCSPGNVKEGWTTDIPGFTGILGAAKLTGKTKEGWSVGVMDAVTNEVRAETDTVGGRFSQPVEPLTNYFLGRIQKDMNSGNTIIGGMVTGTNRVMDTTLATVLNRAAYTGGLDLIQYFRDKSWMVSLNSAFSIVEGTREAIARTQESPARYFQRPDNSHVRFDPMRRSLAGSGGRLEVMKMNGHINLMGVVLWRTPGFETNDLGYLRQADQVIGVLSATYNQWEPRGIYNKFSVTCPVYYIFDFGGDCLSRGLEPGFNITFRNYWNGFISTSATTNQLSSSLLRGGPLMRIPGSYKFQSGFSTDNRRKIIMSVNAGRNGQYLNSSRSDFFSFGVQFKPSSYFTISLSPQISSSSDQLQYVTTVDQSSTPRYIFATIHQNTVSASLRTNINLSPDLSLQYWGQPFLSAGKYSDYKYITDPMAHEYNDRFHTFSASQVSGSGSNYDIDEDGDGKPDYRIGAGDFNYQAFLSNLVVRWEFKPGSSVYFVWSQSRKGLDDTGIVEAADLGSLFSIRPVNIFLVKFSYRFGLNQGFRF